MQQAHDIIKAWDAEAAAMATPPREEPEAGNTPATAECNIMVGSSGSNKPTAPFMWQREVDGKQCPNTDKLCRDGYPTNKTFHKILEHPEDHKPFEVKHGLINYSPNEETRALCIPHSEFRGRRVTKLVIDQVHRIIGHMGPSITEKYAWCHFWWPSLGSNVKAFCNSCATCQAIKPATKDCKACCTHYRYRWHHGHWSEWTLWDLSHLRTM